MIVAYDYQIFSTQPFGGISRYFVETIRRLRHHPGITPRVYAGIHFNQHLRDAYLPGVRGLYLVERRGNRRLRKFVNEEVIGRGVSADICHVTYYGPRAPLIRSRRRVLTVYDMIHELFAAEFSPNDRTTEYKRRCVEEADSIIAISHSTKRDLVRLFGTPPEKVQVIHLGVDFASRATGAMPPTRTKPFLLYTGPRRGYKNFDGLLRAYHSSPRLQSDVELVAFGAGPPNPTEQSRLAELGLTDRVRFVQGGDDVLAGLYRTATAFVCPSLYEGFGLPPLEAMSLGCPVVAADNSSITEVVGDGGILVDGGNPEALAHALERVVSDNTLRTDLIERGHARARLFTWEKCAAQHADLYRTISTS